MNAQNTTPFWWTTAKASALPALEQSLSADVVVIGGGFTGLTAAYEIKKIDPSLRVVILENQFAGFGASGRNAGFAMTLFGLNLSITKLRFGAAKTKQAHDYMCEAVDTLWDLIQSENLEVDAERTGFLRLATSPAYLRRMKSELKMAASMGIKEVYELGEKEAQSRVSGNTICGAWWEPRCVILNPFKLALEKRRLCLKAGVEIFENSPALEVKKADGQYIVSTSNGRVKAKKIVFATNGFSRRFANIRGGQVPVYTHIVLTRPLSSGELEGLGWKGREGLEDSRNLIHYFRLTRDNRLLMGGGSVKIPGSKNFGIDPAFDSNLRAFRDLKSFVSKIFPSLKEVDFEYQWGGPVSVTLDMAPALGFANGDPDAVYSYGCIGHGVSMTHSNGRTVAELLMGKKSTRTEAFFVNRKIFRWPPSPMHIVLGKAIEGYMRVEDRLMDSPELR